MALTNKGTSLIGCACICSEVHMYTPVSFVPGSYEKHYFEILFDGFKDFPVYQLVNSHQSHSSNNTWGNGLGNICLTISRVWHSKLA